MSMLIDGPKDLDLNAIGIKKAISLSSICKEIDDNYVVSSALKRCFQTSKFLIEDVNYLKIEPRLSERYFGDWSKIRCKVVQLFEIHAGAGLHYGT